MADAPTGLNGALAGQITPGAPVEEPEEQLELVEMAQLPLLGEVIRDGKPVGVGRPKGSLNKSTKVLAEYILGRHRHPVVAAAQICDMPLRDLARELGCERLEAAKYQQQCREFVAKYTVQAMPQAVTFDPGTVGMLMVINQHAPRPGQQEGSAWALDITPHQQNQALSKPDPAKSHEEKSNGSE